jgi:predicted permease
MHEALQTLGSVIPLFLLLAIGAAIRRAKILNEQADRTMLDLCVHVLLPCLILDHVMASEELRRGGNLFWSPFLGFVCMAGSIGVAAVAARLWRFKENADARTFTFVTGVFNYGYIPVPLIAALYPKAFGVLFLFNLGTEIGLWTVGFGSFQKHSLLRDWRRSFTTPVQAILLGVAVNLISAQFGLLLDAKTLDSVAWGWPVKVIFDAIHMIGSCSIPLALLIIGATMADFWGEFQSSGGYGVMCLGVLVRNLICPIGFFLLAWLLPISQELKETLVVQGAMPTGVLTLLLVRHYGGDVPVALQVIFSTSAAAIITIPIWIHIGAQLVAQH